jgi:hypothetical protein
MRDDELIGIILHGLQPHIRMHTLNKAEGTLNDLVRTAKMVEAVAPPAIDTQTAILAEVVKAQMQPIIEAIAQQTREQKSLNSKVAAFANESAIEKPMQRINQNPVRRGGYRQTPQIRQRDSYARDFPTRSPQGGAAGFQQRTDQQRTNQQQEWVLCKHCGRYHQARRCWAEEVDCKNCGRRGHVWRICTRPPPQQH